MSTTLPVLHRPPSAKVLEDNAQFENRFEVKSETSGSLYVIAQHKTGRWWGCGCTGWIRWRKCKHLKAVGLPAHQVPYEALLK